MIQLFSYSLYNRIHICLYVYIIHYTVYGAYKGLIKWICGRNLLLGVAIDVTNAIEFMLICLTLDNNKIKLYNYNYNNNKIHLNILLIIII